MSAEPAPAVASRVRAEDAALPTRGRPYTLADRVHPPWRRSLVAGINARFRAREAMRPDAVLRDEWADRLGERHVALRLLEWLEWALPPVRRVAEAQIAAHVVRHAAIDALVREALDAGFGTVAIVGAGYDMRAARLARPGVRWFEVDHSSVLARKERLLAGVPDAPAVTRVALDVATGSVLDALRAAGVVGPTCFVVEGLLHYLPRSRAEALLRELAAPGNRVIVSWIEPDMSERVTTTFREVVRILGEIPRTFFTGAEIASFTVGAGPLRAWSFADQVRSFAPLAAGRPVGLTQEVGVAGAMGNAGSDRPSAPAPGPGSPSGAPTRAPVRV